MRAIICLIVLALGACSGPAFAADPPQLPYALDAGGHRVSAQGVVILGQDGTPANAVASGSADSGNPQKIGCVYNSALPTVTNGQRVDWQCQANGAGNVTMVGTNGAAASIQNPNSDGIATNTAALAVRAFCYYYNGTTLDRCPGSAAGQFVVAKGVGSISTGQVSIGTSSTLVAAARTGRAKIEVSVGAANGCAFGASGVTTSTGFLLPAVAGSSKIFAFSGALYAACTATTTISFLEEY